MGIQMAIELWESNLSHFIWCRGMLHCSYRKRIDMYSFCPGLEFPLVMQEEKVTVSVLNFLFFIQEIKVTTPVRLRYKL